MKRLIPAAILFVIVIISAALIILTAYAMKQRNRFRGVKQNTETAATPKKR